MMYNVVQSMEHQGILNAAGYCCSNGPGAAEHIPDLRLPGVEPCRRCLFATKQSMISRGISHIPCVVDLQS